MDKSEIDILISKFLDNETTEQENVWLLKWIQVPDNRSYLEEFIRTEIWIKYSLNSSEVEKQLSKLSIYPEQKGKSRFRFLSLAAVFVFVLAIGTFLYFKPWSEPLQQWDSHAITLEISNGDSSRYYSLETDKDFSVVDKWVELENNGLLDYSSKTTTLKKANKNEYHTVHVPYGKTFKVKLGDESLIHLNAGSRLTYPSHFEGLDVREVSLVGEAYFKIAKDSIPFIVKTEGLSTKVLGTEFNVSAYNDEELREVVLVEGVLQVQSHVESAKSATKTMRPNQRASIYQAEKALSIIDIDPEDHIAWTKGELVFFSEGIDQIIKKLERKFNVEIRNRYDKLEALHFNGRFKQEDITAVLETIKAHTNFSYTMEGNTIIIEEP